jgi:3-oxoadipate enol-lactonase
VWARDGTRLYYEQAGDPSAPAVLLLMGLGFSGELWSETRDRLLADGYRTITMDNRGIGRSDVPRRAFTISDMADDAVAVLTAASVPRAHVVGVSLGGMIAQRLALAHRGRVRSLVLQSTTAGLSRADFASPTGIVRTVGLLRARLAGRDMEAQTRAAMRLLTTRAYVEHAPFDDRRLQAYVDALQEDVPAAGWARQIQAAARHRAWRQLHDIRAPTLVQHGTRDQVVRAAAGRSIAARIPNARLELYKTAGHLLVLQRPDSLDRLVAFLAAQGT